MKKHFLTLTAVFAAFALTSCETYDGDGIVITETRNIANFDEISLPINAELVIKQGPATSLVIEGESNVLAILRSEVRNGRLRFSYDENWVRTNQKVRIWVTTPILEEISMSSSGKVISDNTIISDNLRIYHSGSGVVDVAADVRRELDVQLNGSGLVYLEGDSRTLDLELHGSGEIQAFNLETDNTEIDLTGSGVCETRVYKNLDVRLSGSGDVYFKGRPAIVNSKITGSGRLLVAD